LPIRSDSSDLTMNVCLSSTVCCFFSAGFHCQWKSTLLNSGLNLIQSFAIPAQSRAKSSDIVSNVFHSADPQISLIASPKAWIKQNTLPVSQHTRTVTFRNVSQHTCIRTLVVTVGIEEMLSRLELHSVGLSIIISGSYIQNRSHSWCETFPRQRWDMMPVNLRPKQRPRAAADQDPRE
jgi:hypothetical protein